MPVVVGSGGVRVVDDAAGQSTIFNSNVIVVVPGDVPTHNGRAQVGHIGGAGNAYGQCRIARRIPCPAGAGVAGLGNIDQFRERVGVCGVYGAVWRTGRYGVVCGQHIPGG